MTDIRSFAHHFSRAAGVFCAAVVLVTVLVSAGCKEKPTTPTQAAPKEDPSLIRPAQTVAAQLTVEAVSEQPARQVLRIPGGIGLNETHVARIGSNVTGRITEVHALRGQPVKSGSVLATVRSNELGEAQFALLKAKADTELLERAAQRASQLFQADVISEAELQRRNNELQVAKAQLRSTQNQLRVLGMSDPEIRDVLATGNIHSEFTVLSTLAGIVVDRKVTRGQVVQPADELFTVADLSSVWVVAEVPEQESSALGVGQPVRILIPALGGEPVETRLIYVSATVDPETRTVLVRSELANPKGLYKPQMLATVLIESASVRSLMISEEAVIREDGKEYVFVEAGPGRYRFVPVELGPEWQRLRPVKSGLTAGQRIVTKGAFHLNGERRKKDLGG